MSITITIQSEEITDKVSLGGTVTITSSDGAIVIGTVTATRVCVTDHQKVRDEIMLRISELAATTISLPTMPRESWPDFDWFKIDTKLDRWGYCFDRAPRYLGPSGSFTGGRNRRPQARACRMDRRRWKRRRFIHALRATS